MLEHIRWLDLLVHRIWFGRHHRRLDSILRKGFHHNLGLVLCRSLDLDNHCQERCLNREFHHPHTQRWSLKDKPFYLHHNTDLLFVNCHSYVNIMLSSHIIILRWKKFLKIFLQLWSFGTHISCGLHISWKSGSGSAIPHLVSCSKLHNLCTSHCPHTSLHLTLQYSPYSFSSLLLISTAVEITAKDNIANEPRSFMLRVIDLKNIEALDARC